jgi:hypothetical protein
VDQDPKKNLKPKNRHYRQKSRSAEIGLPPAMEAEIERLISIHRESSQQDVAASRLRQMQEELSLGQSQVPEVGTEFKAKHESWEPQIFQAEIAQRFTFQRIRQLAQEMASRRMEALRLYEPTKDQESFHRSNAQIRVVRGSNRAGKTLASHLEVARAVLGVDPHGKYPKRDGRCILVGKDLRHIGQVMWRKLSKPGAFKMIRDINTKEWRAFRPWNAEDLEREAEAKPAPPLIPARCIENIAWEDKKNGVPAAVYLTSGWEIRCFSSLGKPPNGIDVDLSIFDEEITDPDWYPEIIARLLDRQGKFVWSATPQAGSDELYDLHERAVKERMLFEKGRRQVEEFILLLEDNPHIKEEDKLKFIQNLSEEERRVRVQGDFAITSFKVYPEFSMPVHGIDLDEIPPHWTRYAAVDPGHQVCAVLFAAVPPPEEGDMIVLYDELYLREADAIKFAENLKIKVGQDNFQAFIIDRHMAIHTELGRGKTVMQQYSEAMEEFGVKSAGTGSGFILGNDDVSGGIMAVHGAMRVRPDGTPKLRVRRGWLPNFEDEIRRYHKLRVNGVLTDKPNQKRNNHLADATRYLIMYEPQFVRAKAKKKDKAGAIKAFRDKEKRKSDAQGGAGVHLGPKGGGQWM